MREKRGSKKHLKRAIIGAPAKSHLNGIFLAGRCWPNIECWFGTFVASYVIFQEIQTKETLYFCKFSGGPPLDPPMILWADFVKKVDFVAIRTYKNPSIILQNHPTISIFIHKNILGYRRTFNQM